MEQGQQQREISIAQAQRRLHEEGRLFTELFSHGSLSVEFYRPQHTDLQQPHSRDEVYVIASGSGTFFNGTDRWSFHTGDFIFVPAGTGHRFEDFSADFATWVFFYGPEGGEAGTAGQP